jgi:hypothetical protein
MPGARTGRSNSTCDLEAASQAILTLTALGHRDASKFGEQAFYSIACLGVPLRRCRERAAITPDPKTGTPLLDLRQSAEVVEQRTCRFGPLPKTSRRACPISHELPPYLAHDPVELAGLESLVEHVQQLGQDGDVGARE